MMLGPVLQWSTARCVADALTDSGNRLYQLTGTEKDDARIVEELFLAVLGAIRPRRKRKKA